MKRPVQLLVLACLWMAFATRGQSVLDAIHPIPALQENEGKFFQPVSVTVAHNGAEADGTIGFEGVPARPIHLKPGKQTFEISAPAVTHPKSRRLVLQVGDHTVASQLVPLQPVRHLTIYVLPHSHNDIGYTESQQNVENKQVNNLLEGMEAARRTADYPEGARFVWNLETLWAADLYLHRMTQPQREDFLEAVECGHVALNGMYANELTGLCRPEELLRLFRFSTQLAQRCGVTIDSAMISDVPGATWGTVTALNQAGIKYLSTAPNYFDRIGDILVTSEDRPFYWESRSGQDKVLVWVSYKGYALSHINQNLSLDFVGEYAAHLDKIQYPYEISYIRWSGHGDNAAPDPAICDFIKDWNVKYTYPKFIISSASDAFHAFEKRYAHKLPVLRGDWTPYWEDGAGSSALETAMNRTSAERLTQAETLWAMINPKEYPAGAFDEAWRNVLLYSEHTWGADISVLDPENPKTVEQWKTKRSYALAADTQSRSLLEAAFVGTNSAPSQLDVINTESWPRTSVIEVESAGSEVFDTRGHSAPSQRLANGNLAFLARDIPPFARKRFTFGAGPAEKPNCPPAKAEGITLDNGLLHISLDEQTGGIAELRATNIADNLVDVSSGHSINDYLYLPGDNLAHLKKGRPVTIAVREAGPLVASLVIDADAPGCRGLTREIRLTAGADYVELIDTVDKAPSPLPSGPHDWTAAQQVGKESINFAFPFNVPGGRVRIDTALSMMEPEIDQIPGACKNWFPVNRWVDVANDDFGVTWVSLDAPLVEIGEISANLLGSQRDPAAWRKKVGRTQKIYSWAMNNHWHTNYRASQDGKVVFRYILRPHLNFAPEEATRFSMGMSQPLIAHSASNVTPGGEPRLQLSSQDAVVTALKPTDDGKGWIVRLFGAAGKSSKIDLSWADPQPKQLWLSDSSERPLEKIDGPVSVPAWGLVSLRAEW